MMTPEDVAAWMVDQVDEYSILSQQEAARYIQATFGDQFVCLDRDGELGIARPVLRQFQKLTGDSVVWVAVQSNWLEGFWRKREVSDSPGRRQYFY